MFERKIKKEYLKLSQIIYGGVLYLELRNYKLKELKTSKFQKVTDSLLSEQGNNEFYAYKNDETGFVGNVFDNGKNLVIAYRGTERPGLGENVSDIGALMKDAITDINLMTANYDKQFKDAWEFYKVVKKENPNRKIIIVGQSLGGALAQIVAAKEFTVNRKKIETYTFNAPGCSHLLETYDCNEKYIYPFITNYSVMNDWCGMFGEHVGKRYLIKPIELETNREDASTPEILNNILLKTHEGIFDYTEKTMGKVIRKPKDFNQKEGLALWYFDNNNPLKNYANVSEFAKGMNINVASIPTSESFSEKADKFFKENLPEEVQQSSIAVAIKNAMDNIVSGSNEQLAKITESFNNNTVSVAIRILDSVFAELSLECLENAKRIVSKLK